MFVEGRSLTNNKQYYFTTDFILRELRPRSLKSFLFYKIMVLHKYINKKDLNESNFKQIYLTELRKSFVVMEEWKGVAPNGDNVRIDAVIRPIDNSNWANKKIVFGVEFKSPTKLKSEGMRHHFVKQSIDYSYCNFDKLGYIPILIAPSIDFDPTYSDKKARAFTCRLLNQFGVGELEFTNRGLSIIYAENDFIWTDVNGVLKGKTYLFNQKFGCKK